MAQEITRHFMGACHDQVIKIGFFFVVRVFHRFLDCVLRLGLLLLTEQFNCRLIFGIKVSA